MSDTKSKPTAKTFPIKLLKDWWDNEGIRQPAAKIIDAPVNEALRLIADRKAERADLISV